MLGVSHSQSGRFGEEKNLFPAGYRNPNPGLLKMNNQFLKSFGFVHFSVSK
jgi:hypothetical protein